MYFPSRQGLIALLSCRKGLHSSSSAATSWAQPVRSGVGWFDGVIYGDTVPDLKIKGRKIRLSLSHPRFASGPRPSNPELVNSWYSVMEVWCTTCSPYDHGPRYEWRCFRKGLASGDSIDSTESQFQGKALVGGQWEGTLRARIDSLVEQCEYKIVFGCIFLDMDFSKMRAIVNKISFYLYLLFFFSSHKYKQATALGRRRHSVTIYL